ncbi:MULTISPECIES: type III secretion system inner membrane ring lipoprotein SctJ [unclassified Paraburkholderia]|uniref:type III secretion system inner membrane ring lipoprotein SctJ n=1 Tax=unclassified Paraburkholderia TaxID=2615204 RepID=UPI002AB1D10A|nr:MULTISPECIES: type III secretion inner membrane ring lipoprotein SctJ [unclassified Paraburkholderia]
MKPDYDERAPGAQGRTGPILRQPPALRRLLPCVSLALLLALAGCKKELYGQLSEQDCNVMVATLIEYGVDAQKSSPDGGKTWSVAVDDAQIVRAMQVLRARGIPENKYDNLGALFKKDGLVSTPTEERVRFIYGLSQELSDTLSKIDGVVVARVQIVLPDNDPLAQTVRPSSAAVFIKYRPDASLDRLVPAIKNLVVHSIEGLTYDQVSVTAIAADPLALAPRANAANDLLIYAGGALGMVLLLGAAAFALMRARGAASHDGVTALAAKLLKRGAKGAAAAQASASADVNNAAA